jgi:hypothetical protein
MGVDSRPGVKGSIEVAGVTVIWVSAGPAVGDGYQGRLTARTSTRVAKRKEEEKRRKNKEV